MTTKLILWDIDGTLVYFRGAGRRAAERAFEHVYQINDVAGRTANVEFAGATDGRIMREMAVACGIGPEEYDAKINNLREYYLKLLDEQIQQFAHDPLLPGAAPALDQLSKASGVFQALLTGNYEKGAFIKLKAARLDHYFKVGGFGDDHEERRIVASVARDRSSRFHQIQADPRDVVVIGDTIYDVDCALANGFRCIAVCTGRFDKKTLADAGAHHVLDNLQSFHLDIL